MRKSRKLYSGFMDLKLGIGHTSILCMCTQSNIVLLAHTNVYKSLLCSPNQSLHTHTNTSLCTPRMLNVVGISLIVCSGTKEHDRTKDTPCLSHSLQDIVNLSATYTVLCQFLHPLCLLKLMQ